MLKQIGTAARKDIEELTGEEANNMIRELLAMSEKK